jgi:hypothetical protein
MIWRMLPIAGDSERIEKDSRFRARKLRGGAILYGCSLLFGIVSVIRGDSQAWAPLSASIPGMFIWWYIRAAKDVKNSEQSSSQV